MKKSAFLPALSLFLTVSFSAVAEEPELLGTYKDWSAYTYTENGSKVCFMSTQPVKEEGAYKKRGDVFMYITHRPSEKALNVVSIMGGYAYKEGSTVTVTVDGKDFSLTNLKDETAWTADEETDKTIVEAIRRGSSMVVKGISKRSTETTDTYSLNGSADAYKAIDEGCGG